MKVSFVITDLGRGGAEIMLCKLLEASESLRKGKVIALGSGGDIAERIRALGVRVESLNMHPRLPNPWAIQRLTWLLRKDKPSVISTWMYHADLLGGLAGRMLGVPVVWNLRQSNLDPDKTKLTTRLVVRSCAALSSSVPRRIVSCSEAGRKVHADWRYDKERMVIIPNGFNLDTFRPDAATRAEIRSELGVDQRTPLVGLIARYDPQKNHLGFLDAAQKVHSKYPSVRFLFAGTGVTEENRILKNAIDRHGLSDAIILLGCRNDIPKIMPSLDMLASSSHGEAFPNVLGEAMACGVPCVVTDAGDSAYIVGDAGVVVPLGDMTQLANGMLTVLSMPPEALVTLGQKARERVTQLFDIRSVAKKYEDVFAEVACGSNSF